MANKRITTWAITIHTEDKDKDGKALFDKSYLEDYLKANFKSNNEVYFIWHDKDGEEDEDGSLHCHLCIKTAFNQGKTFTRMKTLFPQSHLEECFNFDNAVLYLTHETPKAKEDGKYQYPREEVINVFNTDILRYYDKPTYEVFDFDKIEEYINDRGLTTILDYGRTFGYSVISSKWATISTIIKELFREDMRKNKATIKSKSEEELAQWEK